MRTFLTFLAALTITANVTATELIVATTSDYVSGSTAVYYPGTGDFMPAALGQDHQDTVVDTDGEYVYFLSRGLGSVTKYHPFTLGAEPVSSLMIWQYSVGPDSNPQDMVFVDDKAYVIRLGSSEILVVDPDAADEGSFVLGTIDISMYDGVGVPEAVYGFEYGGMVYVVLQRLNGFAADKPGYLIAINPVDDSVLDLVPETNGIQGIELLVKNPQSFSQAGSVAYIAGHDWSGQTEGVQSVDLADPELTQTMLLDEAALMMDITGVRVFDAGLGLCYSSSWVQEGGEWVQVGTAYWFNPATGVLGDAIPVPMPEGGAVMVDEVVYVGSRDNDAPGIYPVDPVTNVLAGQVLATPLPVYSMASVDADIPDAVAETDVLPEALILDAPCPNPFNPATTLSFTLMTPGETEVAVYAVTGQKVATLAAGMLSAGRHDVVWRAEGVAAGMYVVSVRHAGMVKTVKVLLVK